MFFISKACVIATLDPLRLWYGVVTVETIRFREKNSLNLTVPKAATSYYIGNNSFSKN